MWSLMPQVAREMGVRTDVPYKDLTDAEKDIVLHGPMEKRHVLYVPKNKDHATELDFTYYSAVNTVRNALAKAKDEKGMARGLVAGRAARLAAWRGPVASAGDASDVRFHHERDDRANPEAGAAGAGVPHPRPCQRNAFER